MPPSIKLAVHLLSASRQHQRWGADVAPEMRHGIRWSWHCATGPLMPTTLCIWIGACRLVSATISRLIGLLFGVAEGTILKFYQYVVDPAPPDSWPNKLFVRLAKGPLR